MRISPTGAKTFFAEGNFKRSRQTKRLTLGRYPVISVDVARSKAREVLYQWYVGIDPRLEEKRQQEADRQKNAHEKARVITLSEIVDRYFSNRSLKSEEEYRKVLRRIFGDWMERSLQEITRQDIEDRYCQIALTRGHRAQANKAMRYLSSIMNFALAESIEGTPLLRNNPVKVLSDKKYDRSTKAKITFLELHQLEPWINAVQSLCSPLARDLLLLQVQTGLRDSEAKGLLWKDINLNVAVPRQQP